MASDIKSADDLIMDSILAYQAGDLEQSGNCIHDAVESKITKHFEDILAKKYCEE